MIFDGKALAREIEERVRKQVQNLGVKPKIVSILVGEDPASELYTRLKKSASERCGIDFLIERLDARCQMKDVLEIVEKYGKDKSVTGVMVQLPLPEGLRGGIHKLLTAIPLTKDVDGLRWEESKIMPATVRAILAILDKIALESSVWNLESSFVVVGARGAVGRPLVHYLREWGKDVVEVEWDTPNPRDLIVVGEVVISCTGKAGMVTGEMVRDGVVVIDVGSPRGDMAKDVYQKASVAVPSPGGVGPVTIACLMENAVSMV